ncbi:hypothetical protein EXIGLDRAFT_769530 [Exidia glandulosa HHB12029]|uniref:Ataxin-10 homolog n=1 Tax=Exidia glandulosa HHB12029 TaxID=1314781 RepID=A0A165HEC0_EXIGL|nr:hypothetical protein EXIGLDRAFT_769530 [Exidia glandulosa HHB12029]
MYDVEPITPAQTTFLKLLDAYLQTRKGVPDTATYAFLVTAARSLLSYCQSSLRAALDASVEPGSGRSIIPQRDASVPPATDARLPKVCEAVVLVCQCLVVLLLQEEETSARVLKPALLEDGTLELQIDTMRLLDAFLPRVSLHAAPNTDLSGFAYVKRDLVRVLGTLAYEDRDVQDRIRAAGGVQVVLNLCVEDARNPYLREHAILALRNLLKDNTENQQILEELKLTGVEDASGILRDVRRGARP